jgi:DNA-binding transcriptional MerR regulator
VLVPSRVDQASGYRCYDTAQLDEARLVVMLRQLQLPLAAVKELLACDPADAATQGPVTAYVRLTGTLAISGEI